MNIDAVARNIQIILAPVVMVTACAILLQGLLGRYAAINERLRALAAERIMLVFKDLESSDFRTERLRLIDTQVPTLLNHHKRAHDSVLSIYAATLIFIVDMFVIAFAALYESSLLADTALLVFLAGIATMMLGVIFTSLEIRTSHLAVRYEVTSVMNLPEQNPPRTGPDVPGMDDKLKLPIEG